MKKYIFNIRKRVPPISCAIYENLILIQEYKL